MTDALLDPYLPATLPDVNEAKAYAPSNIALAKYWGKRDAALNLPVNSSLSVSLANWGSVTTVSSSVSGRDEVVFQSRTLDEAEPFAAKVLRHANLFRRKQNIPLRIVSENSIPTAAGLASSASGFAALTLALDRAFGLDLSVDILSMIARLGSGSASRSLWHGFVRWDKGAKTDGIDSIGHPLNCTWPEFRIAIVPIDTGPKSLSSTEGMNHTVASSPLYTAWPQQAEMDCDEIESAIVARDLKKLGETAEANALAMHATMQAARPSLSYLKPESWQAIDAVRAARQDGLQVFATMDAGANVKLIFEEDASDDVEGLFPKAKVIAPFEKIPAL